MSRHETFSEKWRAVKGVVRFWSQQWHFRFRPAACCRLNRPTPRSWTVTKMKSLEPQGLWLCCCCCSCCHFVYWHEPSPSHLTRRTWLTNKSGFSRGGRPGHLLLLFLRGWKIPGRTNLLLLLMSSWTDIPASAAAPLGIKAIKINRMLYVLQEEGRYNRRNRTSK